MGIFEEPIQFYARNNILNHPRTVHKITKKSKPLWIVKLALMLLIKEQNHQLQMWHQKCDTDMDRVYQYITT